MALETLYIDGNNVIGFTSKRDGRLDEREKLLHRLLSFSLPKRCVVVFDGPPQKHDAGMESRRGGLSVRYSGSRKADDFIKERIRRGDTVVTADRDLAHSCKTLQAKVVSPKEFLAGLRPRGPVEQEKPSASSRAEIEMWLATFSRQKEP